jgi:hypothetical protein
MTSPEQEALVRRQEPIERIKVTAGFVSSPFRFTSIRTKPNYDREYQTSAK